MQSTYGVLRISPIASNMIRVSFAKEQEPLAGAHPSIANLGDFREWKYRDSPKLLEMKTRELYLQVDKSTGAITYMTSDKRPLLAERSRESRILEKPTYGNPRARLYLDWAKTETLTAMGSGIRAALSLKGTARYISHLGRTDRLPMVVSDKGYGLMIASTAPTLSCTLPTYGTHLCVDGTKVLDYYFISGKTTEDIINSYRKLCGDQIL